MLLRSQILASQFLLSSELYRISRLRKEQRLPKFPERKDGPQTTGKTSLFEVDIISEGAVISAIVKKLKLIEILLNVQFSNT